jgi:hypothetical protein
MLSVTVPLVLTSSPTNQTVLQGTNISFNVGVSGNYLVYQWYANSVALNNGSRITGATGSTLTLSNVIASDANSYFAVVSNLFGSVTCSPATLTVITNPWVASSPTNMTVIQSDDVTLSVIANGVGLGYQWWLTNGLVTNAVSGATNANYTKLVVQTSDAGQYSGGNHQRGRQHQRQCRSDRAGAALDCCAATRYSHQSGQQCDVQHHGHRPGEPFLSVVQERDQ